MSFIEITKDGYVVDDSLGNDSPLIEAFMALVSKRGFDRLSVACGLNPSPDFGYFELGDRFWRSSLCIYFMGTTGGFIERGAGYPEPWLFNARHAIELYIKGLLLNAFWFEELNSDRLISGHKRKVKELKNKLGKPHNIYEIYAVYKSKITDLISRWDNKVLSTAPETIKLILSGECEDLLKELDQADKSSFRFRYPSFTKNKVDHLNEFNWKHDESELFPKTGLPKTSGFIFNHMKVINGLHSIMKELKSIESYLGGCWDYFGEIQNMEAEMRAFYADIAY